jgi:dipeptidase E
MKLYLSSFGLGNDPQQLVALVDEGKKAVVILNALDHKEEARARFLASQTQALTELGFTVEELDLRHYFDRKEELQKVLSTKDVVWINGGNTFILRRAMRQSGFDAVITDLVKKEAIVYGGFSAAVCILAPTLHGLEITDDPNVVPEGYDKEIIWDGLGIIDYSVAVHYQSDHPESHLTDKEIAFYEVNNMPYKKLRDGEVIVTQ